jgi:hypothetical protein
MKKILFLIIVGVGTILAATAVPANALQFSLNVEYTDGTEPAGNPPWLTADITDVTGGVRITMSTSGLTGTEFVSGWYFNWDFNAADLEENGIDYVEEFSTGPAASGGIAFNTDGLNAGGVMGHGFDILFSFPTRSDNRFEANEVVTYDFFGDGLTASDFDFLNTAGNFYSAAHVQAINGTIYPNDDSGWIGATTAIPEPATIILIGTGLASLFCIRRFRFRNN